MQGNLRAHLEGLAAPIVLAVGGLSLMAVLGLGWQERNDFTLGAITGVEALRRWDIAGFVQNGTVEAGSYLIRAPFVLAVNIWGGETVAAYRMLAVPGLLGAGVLAVVMWKKAREGDGPSRRPWLALLLIAASPFLLSSLLKAHPEEPVGAVLCLGALAAAARQRWLMASVLIGLAIGNKLWAVVAVVPVLILLDGHAHRVRALVVMGITASLVYAPFVLATVLGKDDGELQPLLVATQAGGVFKPEQVWWFLGEPGHLHPESSGELSSAFREGPAWLIRASHPLAVLVPILLSIALAPRLRRRPPGDVLLLLAVAFLLRGMLDIWNNVYYALPFVFTLVAWEVVALRRAPVLSLIVTISGWIILALLPVWATPDVRGAAYLAWSVPLLVGLLAALVRPEARWSRGRTPALAP